MDRVGMGRRDSDMPYDLGTVYSGGSGVVLSHGLGMVLWQIGMVPEENGGGMGGGG